MSTSNSFIEEYKTWLIGSVVLHVVVALAFALSTFTIPRQMPQQLAVQAVLVDETKTKSAKEAVAREQREAKERTAAQARRDREKQKQQKAEQERKAKVQRERKAKDEQQRKQTAERERTLKRDQEQKAIAAREAKAKADADRKATAAAEADRQAKAEVERKAKVEAERQARVEAERKAKADAERKATEAAAARRQAELMASMEAEERLLSARTSGELAQYIALIKQKVERNWAQPAGTSAGIECELYVSQIPGGEVVGVKIGRCNADPAVVRSVEAAVYKSSPLPLPSNPALFERNLRFTFKPQD